MVNVKIVEFGDKSFPLHTAQSSDGADLLFCTTDIGDYIWIMGCSLWFSPRGCSCDPIHIPYVKDLTKNNIVTEMRNHYFIQMHPAKDFIKSHLGKKRGEQNGES